VACCRKRGEQVAGTVPQFNMHLLCHTHVPPVVFLLTRALPPPPPPGIRREVFHKNGTLWVGALRRDVKPGRPEYRGYYSPDHGGQIMCR
jgi:hypothetical protein